MHWLFEWAEKEAYLKAPTAYNSKVTETLKKIIHNGAINGIERDEADPEYHIPCVKIKGRYATTVIKNSNGKDIQLLPEHSMLILNIPLGVAWDLAQQFSQQSFIFGENHKDGTVSVYTYMATCSPKLGKIIRYEKQGELKDQNKNPANQDAENYYSQSKDHNWSFAFADNAFDTHTEDDAFNEVWNVKDLKLLKDSLNENSSFRCFYKRKAAYRK